MGMFLTCFVEDIHLFGDAGRGRLVAAFVPYDVQYHAVHERWLCWYHAPKTEPRIHQRLLLGRVVCHCPFISQPLVYERTPAATCTQRNGYTHV